MNRKKVPHREAARMVAELENTGATGIRRSPVGIDGLVEVTWTESAAARDRYDADMQAGRLPMVISLAVGLLVAGLIAALVV